ncbi:DUF6360 family protein [Natronorubrum sp. DTA28]|uniref:DUF6360 family protein n=1 Tax=Natronorubrum sp. DTA28 TaxID=3447019 RepID=UPI003F841284
MSDRLMSVNAYTTLDYVEATAKGQEFEWESVAVVNATTDTENPDSVHLQLEFDNLSERHLPKHMEDLELTPEQARALAADLEKHAARVENASTENDGGETST